MNLKPAQCRRSTKSATAKQIVPAMRLFIPAETRPEPDPDADDAAKPGTPVEDQTADRSSR